MYVYESHMGGLFALDYELNFEERYCEQCGDSDWELGCANTREEAWELLKDITATFDWSMCDNCPHNNDDSYDCNEECEDFQHSGGYDLNYVIKFIEENWNE